MTPNYDVLIIGGGCAGLSLAMRLASLGPRCPRVALIEQREVYAHDRTWSFWAGDTARLTELSKGSWKKALVRGAGRQVTLDCGEASYQTIRSDDFYRSALASIGENPRITLLLGEAAGTPSKKDGLWTAQTRNGAVHAAQVIDTRPPATGEGTEPILWQSFSGLEVECDSDVFDDRTAVLMDFVDGPSEDMRFLYLLPYGRRRALIEATVFGKRAMSQEELADLLEVLVKKTVGTALTETLHREHHVIPMGLPESRRDADCSYVRVGTAHGGARASTGYVFQRIQRWADAAAASAEKGERLFGHLLDPWIVRKMDALFLRVLRRHPGLGPEIFARLFAIPDSGTLIRFMSDEQRIPDVFRIIRSLPCGVFLKELARGLLR